jgi:rhodanese-related sulfurtransferase
MSPASLRPPDPPVTVGQLLDAARARLHRLTPYEALTQMQRGARLVDIRSDRQRAVDGIVPGSVHVPRNVLEWRLDPRCAYRDPHLARRDTRIVLLCHEGFQSSLAAATLQQFGLRYATDVVGGFQAWRAGGLPVDPPLGFNP